jgi:lambda repressor-like predicted transcriptional regulator
MIKVACKMSASEKIRIALVKRDVSIKELAKKINTTPQNLSNKLSRDSFTVKEMMTIADALNCELQLIMKDTGEKI